VDDIVLMQVRMANDTLESIRISRMGTSATNDMKLEIFGENGAIRFSAEELAGWRCSTCVTQTNQAEA
jgi:predicted dehydrogenase